MSQSRSDPYLQGNGGKGDTLPYKGKAGVGGDHTSHGEKTAFFLSGAPQNQPDSETLFATDHPVPADLVNHPRYRILEFLGSGGMGVVFKAEHRLMDRVVALKIISESILERPILVERFQREVKAAAHLSHPNIVAAYDADQAGHTHFLVMEFVEGVDLDQVLSKGGRLSVVQACDYARQAAVGLQHAWQSGMVHRDIKPHNLMLTPSGIVKILDFGLARFISEVAPGGAVPLPDPKESASAHLASDPANHPVDPEATPPIPNILQKGTAYAYTGAGTADYIAPEEAINPRQADIRADIYSLGCTLYRFLTGRVPFPHGTVLDKLKCHLDLPPDSLALLRPELPPRLTQIVERMMAKDPAQRPQTPTEVARALTPFATPVPQPILVVDDDPLIREAMTSVLENRGYPVACAEDGQEALERLKQGIRPSLVLLDLMMPRMDGWEFLKRQKQDPSLASIPVVIISAANKDHARAIALGAADYLQKPIEMHELADKVQGLAGRA